VTGNRSEETSWQRVKSMNLTIEIDKEDDGRWIAEVVEIPGALADGQSREEAITQVESLALRVLADRLEHGEDAIALENLFTIVA
jgi:predicted RNase H-like HicB family nuclease